MRRTLQKATIVLVQLVLAAAIGVPIVFAQPVAGPNGYSVTANDTPENAGFLEITVTRVGDYNFESTVQIRGEGWGNPLTGGLPPAKPSVDFIDEVLTAHFAPGANVQQTVRLHLINNSIQDGDRAIWIRANNPVPELPITTSPIVSILDNDFGYFLEDSAHGYPLQIESHEGGDPFVTLWRVGDYGATDLLIGFAEEPLGLIYGARAGKDFEPRLTTVHFEAGQTSARVPLPIINDAEVERTEYFLAMFANAVEPGAFPVAHRIPIYDNEFNPLVARAVCLNFFYEDVLSIAPAGSDMLYLLVSNLPRGGPSIVRTTITGELDPTFPAVKQFASLPRRLQALSDGKFLIFESLESADRMRRLNADLTSDTSFVPYSDEKIVAACEAIDGKLFVSSTGTHRPSLLVRLNANGTVDPSFKAPTFADDKVDHLAPDPSGGIYIAGFQWLDGEYWPNNVAHLKSDGSLDRSFQAAFFGDPVMFFGGSLYIAPGAGLTRLKSDGSWDQSFDGIDFGRSWQVLQDGTEGFFVVTDEWFSDLKQSVVERYNSDGSRDASFLRGTFNAAMYDPVLIGRKLVIRTLASNDSIPQLVNGAPSCSDVFVLDLDSAPRFMVEPSHEYLAEEKTEQTVNVIRTGDNQSAASIHYTVISGSAKLGVNFNMPIEGDLNFGPGESRVTIPIQMVNDNELQIDNSFLVSLLDPTRTLLSTHQMNIVSDDIGLKVVSVGSDYIELLPVNNRAVWTTAYMSTDLQSWSYVGVWKSNTPIRVQFNGNPSFFQCVSDR